jgi:2-oxo-4-hydroxy-4-carboxy-5-ureidoimidazoline decarboxylase
MDRRANWLTTGYPREAVGVMTLDEFNALDDEAARRALAACCLSPAWVGAMAAGRPYPTMDALIAASDAAVAGLGEEGMRAALAGHPRIGDRRAAGGEQAPTEQAPAELAPAGVAGSSGSPGLVPAVGASWSSQEQAGVSGAEAEVREALAEGNAEYEARFGHIYLACATGRSATELLAFLRERLGNDRETEWRVVASELAKINQIRLVKLLGGEA